MDRLSQLLKTALETYTGEALNGYSYLTENEDGSVFAVISVGNLPNKRIVDAGLIVRLSGDLIIIERDVNDKPLLDALLQTGIGRESIVLAYAGEVVTEPVI